MNISIIFLHGFWRSSSTYFWNKFRNLYNTIAFYEPFHEILNSNLKVFPSNSSKDWESNHPLIENYWSEYKILCNYPNALFTQYNGSFVKQDYYLLTKEKEAYLKKIIDLCIEKNYQKIVFGCVRTVSNSNAIKRFIKINYPNINQFHIFFDRSPLSQFESYVNNHFYHIFSTKFY